MLKYLPRYSYRHWPVVYGPNDAYQLLCQDFSGLLVSESHYRRRNGSWSGGGPFMVVRRSIIHQQGERLKAFRSNGTTTYASSAGVGGTPLFVLPDVSRSAQANLMDAAVSHSLAGYNRTRPGQPTADLLVGVVEFLRDGIPYIPGQLARVPLEGAVPFIKSVVAGFKNLGSEYLNVVFGWKPFINDLRKFFNFCGTLDEQLRKLIAQNGKPIRRRTVLVDTNDISIETQLYSSAYANVYGGNGTPSSYGAKTYWTRSTVTYERVWYNACYRYWIPNVMSAGWRARAIAILSGAFPTPATVYNAMPWSWLADWFGSVGGVAAMLSPTAVDNLVQLYGFTMRHTLTKVTCNATVMYPGRHTITHIGSTELGQAYDGSDLTVKSTYVDETKVRTAGFHPFGPDKISSGFSPYQISILSALGLTRA